MLTLWIILIRRESFFPQLTAKHLYHHTYLFFTIQILSPPEEATSSEKLLRVLYDHYEFCIITTSSD